LCKAHQTKARLVFKTVLGLSDIQWRKFVHFLKSYLAMEEWFHDSNDKDEVVPEGKYPKFLLHYRNSSPGRSTLTATGYPKCME
jgi:hypothetical protein